MAEQETQIVKQPIRAGSRGIMLNTIEDMYRWAQCVINSGLAPPSFDTPEKVLLATQAGAELDMSPMRALQSFCVVNGAVRLYCDAPLALVRQSGLMEYIKERIDNSGDDMIAVCETKRKGDPEAKTTVFSVADARLAKLWGKVSKSGKPSPWVLYPKRMLQIRARSLNLRDNFPDCFGGATIAEEYQGVEMPQSVAAPQVLPRGQRKDAEDVVVTDTKEATADAIKDMFEEFKNQLTSPVNEMNIDGVPEPILWQALAKSAALIIGDDCEYTEPGDYTLVKVSQVRAFWQANGAQDEVLCLIPQTGGE